VALGLTPGIARASSRHASIPRLRRQDSGRNRIDRRADGSPVTLEYATNLPGKGVCPNYTPAYLQLFQAANAGEFPARGQAGSRRAVRFGWRPHDVGWLSCALQFAGTILFNFNTFDALLPGLDWVEQDLAIWVPNFAGSVLFLASGHLAFAEVSHAHFSWQPKNLSWWVTSVNLLGCVGFMISAVFAVVLPTPPSFDAVTVSVWFTLLGAIGFLIGSLLMLPETARPAAV